MANNIQDSDQASVGNVMEWLVHALQKPTEPVGTALIVVGAVESLIQPLGIETIPISSMDELKSFCFDDPPSSARVFLVDPTFCIRNGAMLKLLLSEASILVRKMGEDLKVIPNHLHMIVKADGEHQIDALEKALGSRRILRST